MALPSLKWTVHRLTSRTQVVRHLYTKQSKFDTGGRYHTTLTQSQCYFSFDLDLLRIGRYIFFSPGTHIIFPTEHILCLFFFVQSHNLQLYFRNKKNKFHLWRKLRVKNQSFINLFFRFILISCKINSNVKRFHRVFFTMNCLGDSVKYCWKYSKKSNFLKFK